MPSVLYLHGFASSPLSQKVQSLRALLEPRGIEMNAPDLNVPSFEKLDFEAMVARALASIPGENERGPLPSSRLGTTGAIAGSSLGALVALEVARRGVRAPLVLIAPALGVADQWLAKIPAGDPIAVYNHARAGQVPIHRAFFEQMARVDYDRHPPSVPVTMFMGCEDESIPFDRVAGVWRSWQASGRLPAGSRFIEIAGGDHRLTGAAGPIAEEIHKAVASDILPKTP